MRNIKGMVMNKIRKLSQDELSIRKMLKYANENELEAVKDYLESVGANKRNVEESITHD
jgi:rubrerythrin